jgi:hypothetical protein
MGEGVWVMGGAIVTLLMEERHNEFLDSLTFESSRPVQFRVTIRFRLASQ